MLKNIRKHCGMLIIFCLLVLCIPMNADAAELTLYAQAAVLLDGENGRVLYGKNEGEVLPMASTTKIMTCIIALEYGNPEDMVCCSEYASSMPKVHLGMKAGNCYKLKDLLFSLMLESHNDSAVAIAEHIGAAVSETEPLEAFLQMMNQKARDIGCRDTFFLTPNGLDKSIAIQTEDGSTVERQHATTAQELALIMRYCVTLSPMKEQFLEITGTPSYVVTTYRMQSDGSYSETGVTVSCTNHNALLNTMEGAVSGKTGYTGKAGYCYVAAIEKNGHMYIVALLACGWPNHKTYKWSDTRTLIAYGTETFTYLRFHDLFLERFGENQHLKAVSIKNSATDVLQGKYLMYPEVAVPQFQQSTGMLVSEEETVEMVVQIPQELKAPIKKGEIIGNIQYTISGRCYNIEYVIATEDVKAVDYRFCFLRVWEMFSWKR